MEKLEVKSSTHEYKIMIGEGIRYTLHQYLTKKYSSILIITDDKVAKLHLDAVKESLANEKVYVSIIPAGEQSKNIDVFYQLHTDAIQYGLDRQSLVIALGGGVVGDLAGFVAATYMRGIDFIQVPTTILAHDSSVGGKVAINHELGKNMIGNFNSPVAVIYDVETLSTLSDIEIRSGYAELVKEALISNESTFNQLMNIRLNEISKDELKKHLSFGIKVKAKIVEEDENESGVRKYLNLGHTLGHAIEAELSYGKLTHGEAVAIGLLFALYVSNKEFEVDLPLESLLTWFKNNDYPLDIRECTSKKLVERMKSDKKATNKKIQMVLLEKVGKPTVKDFDDEVIDSYLQSFMEKVIR
ncbi:3-dehydroquinate synthase [Oceanobacillus caeni]|uniref:3-dehydroquinate synthase n=1 Tax=Bacillaceae TaxID=186817 RepID=UPI000621677C|nr:MULTISPECIES: 3-dehydroquinate synthase [Bacillaceae]KKE79345.1 3-dehydroquinate synthase [Bacilli bacterium VT-13-104]PZD88364.1 3-dehydroquinate synthase [Bacilli bacterium]MBU8789724.1 3-dehydroquinate synthase [Oceanobacillus caeni]MCR1834339.1 3-dehydroquinate synthase [Oceanobacillus caeni]PZD90459.1 3-dehydroquinate synthase [Bacilli bacterium]